MTNLPVIKTITQDAANQTKSKELNFEFKGNNARGQKINAFRLDMTKIQIDDFDAIADGDSYTLQYSYDDQNAATLHTIDHGEEIETVGEDFKVLGTNGPIMKDTRKVALHGVEFIHKNRYIVEETAYLNFDTVGQDAAEAAHVEIHGQYVHLDWSDISKLKQGVSFTN